MNFVSRTSPYIRNNKSSVVNMMKSVVYALLPVTFCALYVYGIQFLATLVVAFISIVGTEYVVAKMFKGENTIYNFTAVITAMIYALILTAGTPLWVVFLGGLFATIFAKLVFGGMGNNIFNPAAIARVFVLVSFGAVTMNETVVEAIGGSTPLATIAGEGLSYADNFAALQANYSINELLIGGQAGAYGESFTLAIIFGAIILMVTKAADMRMMMSAIGMFFLMGLTFAATHGLPLEFAIYQISMGGFLFGAVFMVTDPVTGPSTPPARIMFGLLVGGITFIIRILGAYPEGLLFALILMNMFAPLFDYYKWAAQSFNKGWIIAVVTAVVILLGIAVIA